MNLPQKWAQYNIPLVLPTFEPNPAMTGQPLFRSFHVHVSDLTVWWCSREIVSPSPHDHFSTWLQKHKWHPKNDQWQPMLWRCRVAILATATSPWRASLPRDRTQIAPCRCWKMCKVVTFNCFFVWTIWIRKTSRSLLFNQLHWLIIHGLLQNSSVLVGTTWQLWCCWHHRYSNSFLYHKGQHGRYTWTKHNKRVSSRLNRDSVVQHLLTHLEERDMDLLCQKSHRARVSTGYPQSESASNIQNRESFFQTGWTPSKTEIHTTTWMIQRFSWPNMDSAGLHVAHISLLQNPPTLQEKHQLQSRKDFPTQHSWTKAQLRQSIPHLHHVHSCCFMSGRIVDQRRNHWSWGAANSNTAHIRGTASWCWCLNVWHCLVFAFALALTELTPTLWRNVAHLSAILALVIAVCLAVSTVALVFASLCLWPHPCEAFYPSLQLPLAPGHSAKSAETREHSRQQHEPLHTLCGLGDVGFAVAGPGSSWEGEQFSHPRSKGGAQKIPNERSSVPTFSELLQTRSRCQERALGSGSVAAGPTLWSRPLVRDVVPRAAKLQDNSTTDLRLSDNGKCGILCHHGKHEVELSNHVLFRSTKSRDKDSCTNTWNIHDTKESSVDRNSIFSHWENPIWSFCLCASERWRSPK